MMKAETLFCQQGDRRRRQGLQRDQRRRRQREEPPRPALSAWLVPCRGGRPPGCRALAQRVHHPLSGGPAAPVRPRQARQGLCRERGAAEGDRRFRPPHRPGTPEDLASFAWLESARMRRDENNIPDMILRYQGLLQECRHPQRKPASRGELLDRLGHL
jgi:hypothetical protein